MGSNRSPSVLRAGWALLTSEYHRWSRLTASLGILVRLIGPDTAVNKSDGDWRSDKGCLPSASTRKTCSRVKYPTNAAYRFSQDQFCHLPPMLRWEGRKYFSTEEAAEEALTMLMFCIVLINPTEKPTKAFSSTGQDCCSEGDGGHRKLSEIRWKKKKKKITPHPLFAVRRSGVRQWVCVQSFC